MENNQSNKFNFKEALVNTELGEKLARFKILTEFLSNSLVCCYQTVYTDNKSLTQEEYDVIYDKYGAVKDIIDDTLELLAIDLKKNKGKEVIVDSHA